MFSKYQSQSLSFKRQKFSFWKMVMIPSMKSLHYPASLKLLVSSVVSCSVVVLVDSGCYTKNTIGQLT